MRNGNVVKDVCIRYCFQSFYPTYEEWKLRYVERSIQEDFTFYPTYEEWKLDDRFDVVMSNGRLFILPMRNGNFYEYYQNNTHLINFLSYL